MKKIIKHVPIVRFLAKFVYFKLYVPFFLPFKSSESYWKKRYMKGENSGSGSYKHLAAFKAEIVNNFVNKNKLHTVIEYGCGDGNQLKYFNFPYYTGFDVSSAALMQCSMLFSNDPTKKFKKISDYQNEKAELTLSLDVIYHLVEDDAFHKHMNILFNSSEKYVIIYSSNTYQQEKIQAPHVKHRKFTDWVEQHKKDWLVIQTIPNKYPYTGNDLTGSFADFFIFKKGHVVY